MAIDARKLTLEVVLDGDKLVVKQLQNVEQAGDKAAAAQQLHGIKLATTYTAASQFVRDFIGVVKTAGAEVMQLAKEHADASTNVDKLAIALRSAGNYTAAGAAGLRDFADSMQIMVGQDGYQMLGFMAEAEDKTRVGTDTLKQMGVAAIGLAEINGTELGPAFDKVQRAANGQVKALTEMGIVLPKTATQQERINALLKATAGGFDEAIARVDNVTGKTEILGLVWGDLRVELGGFIDDNPYVMEAFDGIIGAVKVPVPGPYNEVWILAYALFVFEVMLALSRDSREDTVSNMFFTALSYFTYCQLWIPVVVRGFYDDFIKKKERKWAKTERFQVVS